MSLFHYKNLYVRELAWVMCSPNLLVPTRRSQRSALELPLVWDSDCRAYYQRFASRLDQLESDPSELLEWLSDLKSSRIGLRFEHYLHFWLRWIAPGADAVCKGLTLTDTATSGRTLGQLDFLWRDSSGATQHWEAAVKFYLYWPFSPVWQSKDGDTAQWLGPNANDCFEAKLTHLRQRQIPIAASEIAQQTLQQSRWSLPAHSSAFVKGYLFYPLADASSQTQDAMATWKLGGETRVLAPAASEISAQPVSRAHLKGWWQAYPIQHLPSVSPHSQWLVLPKLYWLAPVTVASRRELERLSLELFDQAQLMRYCDSHFQASQRSLMIVEMKTDGAGLHEISRGMLTHPSFPFLTATS